MITSQCPDDLLEQLKAEKERCRTLIKLIWAIVLKQGGEVRLSDIDRGVTRDDWQLLEYEDMETCELVIKARVVTETAKV